MLLYSTYPGARGEKNMEMHNSMLSVVFDHLECCRNFEIPHSLVWSD